MPNPLRSLDDFIKQENDEGIMPVHHFTRITATTAATTTSGFHSAHRALESFTVPSFGGSVTKAHMAMYKARSDTGGIILACLEVDMGTLTVSGNSYSHGSSMPSRTPFLHVDGSSQTTASMIPMVYVSAAVTATTPVLTINYTNQDGTTGRQAQLTLPTSPLLRSGFLVSPHLQSGDTGIRSLSASSPNGLSISTGSAGTIKLLGLIPIAKAVNVGGNSFHVDNNRISEVRYPLLAGDVIAFWRLYNTAQGYINSIFTLVPET